MRDMLKTGMTVFAKDGDELEVGKVSARRAVATSKATGGEYTLFGTGGYLKPDGVLCLSGWRLEKGV